MAEIRLTNTSSASVETPVSGKSHIFIDDVTKKLCYKDDSGVVYIVTSST